MQHDCSMNFVQVVFTCI
ncbi:MAG: hypothetical protein GPJ51_06190 [Candidatus Heimdallarchaeota archaeon]|nr:hypothetical protein [Candidatus Heimdallarchaeota archaeon]